MLVAELEGVDAKAMQEAAQKLLGALGDPGAVVLATRGASGTQANFVAAFSPKVMHACAGVGAWVSLSRKEGILDYTQREGLVTPYLKESPILKMKPFALWAPNA